jgi:hypothetical protein
MKYFIDLNCPGSIYLIADKDFNTALDHFHHEGQFPNEIKFERAEELINTKSMNETWSLCFITVVNNQLKFHRAAGAQNECRI